MVTEKGSRPGQRRAPRAVGRAKARRTRRCSRPGPHVAFLGLIASRAARLLSFMLDDMRGASAAYNLRKASGVAAKASQSLSHSGVGGRSCPRAVEVSR